MKHLITILIFLSLQPAFAYLEIGESNEIPDANTFKFGGLLQGRLSNGSGLNVTAFGDGQIQEEMGWRAFLGGGNTEFYAGGSVKWVPYPDYDRQPAIGGKFEANFGRTQGDTLTVLRLVPIISKKTEWQGHSWVPYAGLPLGISAASGKSDTFVNLAAGTEVQFESIPDFEFNAEIGIGVTKSFSYFGIGVTYLLDTGYSQGRSR